MAHLAAVPGYALITTEGEWIAPGRMGWWGMSSETADDRDQYRKQVNDYIDALPDSARLIAVDCHI